MLLSITLALASVAAAECRPLVNERILASDLGQTDPAFLSIPSTTVAGIAPAPGATRRFTAAELASFARAHHVVPGELHDVCVTVPLAGPLEETNASAAMQRLLPPGARLSVLELPKTPVPQGDVVFPIESLEPAQPGSPDVQVWRGFVKYGQNRRSAVWARVRIQLERPAVYAKRPLRAGEEITPDCVGVEVRNTPLRADRVAGTIAEVMGKTLVRSVKTGDALPLSALQKSLEIRRGDAVHVEVVNGAARLAFSAIAETNARQGDAIQLRNPTSGKMFRARVTGPESAVVAVTLGRPE